MPGAGWGLAAGVLTASTLVVGGSLLGLDASGFDPSSLIGGLDVSQLVPDGSSGFDPSSFNQSDPSQFDPSQYLNQSGGDQSGGGGDNGLSSDQLEHYAHSAQHHLQHYMQNHQQNQGGGASSGGNQLSQFAGGGLAGGQGRQALTRSTGMPIIKNVQDFNVHTCDVCKKHIIGNRFKCLNCPDYDSCPDCADRPHDPTHKFIFIPQAGKFVHCVRGVQPRVCHFCRQGIKTQESFACLECIPLIKTCIGCQAQRDSHLQSTGHQFIIERQGGLECDGCKCSLVDTFWWRCTSCPDFGFCGSCILPNSQRHTPGHYFCRTIAFESYNNVPWGQPDPRVPEHGDEQFWVRIVEHGNASPELRRLNDAIFDYIDRNGPPGPTGLFEPSKNRWYNRQTDPSLTDHMSDEIFKMFHDTFGTPYRMVTCQETGKPIACLDKWGFQEDTLTSIRLDPDEAFKSLSLAIRNWRLVDPASGHPFPPLPRSSMPSFPEPDSARKMREEFMPKFIQWEKDHKDDPKPVVSAPPVPAARPQQQYHPHPPTHSYSAPAVPYGSQHQHQQQQQHQQQYHHQQPAYAPHQQQQSYTPHVAPPYQAAPVYNQYPPNSHAPQQTSAFPQVNIPGYRRPFTSQTYPLPGGQQQLNNPYSQQYNNRPY